MDVSMHLTPQYAGLGEREGSPELQSYDSADIFHLYNLLQSCTLSWTSLSSFWLWPEFHQLIVFQFAASSRKGIY